MGRKESNKTKQIKYMRQSHQSPKIYMYMFYRNVILYDWRRLIQEGLDGV